MADFKVGDKVFLECEVHKLHDDRSIVRLPCRDLYAARNEHLIPASRVTIAKTRRAARMPEDYGKEAWFFDDDGERYDAVLCGYVPSVNYRFLDNDGDMWKFCEVEE